MAGVLFRLQALFSALSDSEGSGPLGREDNSSRFGLSPSVAGTRYRSRFFTLRGRVAEY